MAKKEENNDKFSFNYENNGKEVSAIATQERKEDSTIVYFTISAKKEPNKYELIEEPKAPTKEMTLEVKLSINANENIFGKSEHILNIRSLLINYLDRRF